MKRRRKTEKTEQYKRQNGYCTCIEIAHRQHRCTKAAHMIFVMIQVTWTLVPAIKYKEKKRNICRIKMNGFTTFLSLSYQRTKRSWCLKHDKRRFFRLVFAYIVVQAKSYQLNRWKIAHFPLLIMYHCYWRVRSLCSCIFTHNLRIEQIIWNRLLLQFKMSFLRAAALF